MGVGGDISGDGSEGLFWCKFVDKAELVTERVWHDRPVNKWRLVSV